MTKPQPPTAVALTLALAFAQVAQAQEPAARAERHPLLAFVDLLDPLDTTTLQLVRVDSETNGYVQSRFGWVLNRQGRRYQLRYLDLGRGTVTSNPRIRVAPVGVRDAVVVVRDQARAINDRGFPLTFFPSPDDPMHPRTLALLLARACERRGLHDAKNDLLEAAGTERTYFARDLRRRVVMNMCDPKVSWQQLLQQRVLINKTFAVPRVGLHLDREDVFEQVIAELSNPKTPNAKRFLIEDPWLDGNSKFDSGPMLSPEPEPPAAQRPLTALVRQGLTVVPDLIALLDDTTATRSINWSTKFGGVFSYNTVGDQAHAALTLIVGDSPLGAHLRRDRRTAWQTWFEQKGGAGLRKAAEERLDRLRSDDIRFYLSRWPDGIEHILRLIEAWPHKALPSGAITALLADPRWGKLPRVRNLANRCFAGPMHDPWRPAFAKAMLEAGMPEGLTALRTTWNKRNLVAMQPGRTDYLDDICVNLHMLMLHGDKRDWQTIRTSNEFDEVRKRCALVLLHHPQLLVEAGLHNPQRSADLAAAKETLSDLLRSTTQVVEQRGIPSRNGPVQLHDITCADAAAIALSNLGLANCNYQLLPSAGKRHQQLPAILEALEH